MARCDSCMTNPVHPDKKCCFNCARVNTNCEVWHNCGEDCPGWENKVKTNADRIRSMTDEELAVFLGDDDRCCPPKHPNCKKYVNDCSGCFLEWLKQPAEVE